MKILLLFCGVFLILSGILIIQHARFIDTKNISICFEKGDTIPADWYKVTPEGKFQIRIFGMDCVLRNGYLYSMGNKHDVDSAFIEFSCPSEEITKNATISATDKCPKFVATGILIK